MSGITLDQLRERTRGMVIDTEDPAYDVARKVYNGMIDRRPAVVVRPVNVGDVMAAVDLARENGVDLAIRGGGHSVPGFGTCDGGVVIDLSAMRGVHVDPVAGLARAEGGATWGDFNAATYPFGLATTGGIISTTGVAGLTLGGGIGYLDRAYGLSCDNLVSADVVTADGRFVTASETDNADLLWALRGGGGNFGVVTSFEFRVHPVKDIYGGPMFYDLEDAEQSCGSIGSSSTTPPSSSAPSRPSRSPRPCRSSPKTGTATRYCLVVACWAGPLDEGERVLKPFHDVAPVVAEFVGPMPYPALNSAFDALVPPGLQHYWKANFVTELTDEAIRAHLQHGPKVPVVNSTMHIYPINGACHRVAPDATAFAYRDANFAAVIAGMWPDPADNDANIRWVRDYYDAVAPHSERGGYVNFMADDDQDRIRDNYRGNYERLAADQAEVRPGQPVPPEPEHRGVMAMMAPPRP